MIQKIHFINRMCYGNTGDWICSPICWYYDYFKNYNVIRHNINSVDWHVIGKNDLVILGGGGLLYASVEWNRTIERLLEKTAGVIAWSVGHNFQNNIKSLKKSSLVKIDFNKMDLVGIRDYKHESGLSWLPCVTCKSPELNKESDIKRRFGVVEHHYYPIKIAKELPLEKINNSYTIEEITDFIASSEVIITNAYHIIYFSQLMGKKVICIDPFSDKYDYLKYKPLVIYGKVTEKKLEAATSKLSSPPEGFLEEAIKLNDSFFEQVKKIVERKIIEPGNEYSYLYNTAYGGVGSMRREIEGLYKRTSVRGILARLFKCFRIK